jgi:hypothetical protein
MDIWFCALYLLLNDFHVGIGVRIAICNQLYSPPIKSEAESFAFSKF